MLSSQLSRYSQVATGMKTPSNKINSIEFNLSTQYYGNLIQQIRSIAPQPGRYSHNRPILPIRYGGVAPQDWLDIVLSTADCTIIIRLRLDNLYLVGYRMQSGSWHEFDPEKLPNGKVDPTHLIPGSEFLGYTGAYPSLARAGKKPIKGTSVSRAVVIGAVNGLGNADSDEVTIARGLTLLAMVICEATRFEEMSRRFADVIHSRTKSMEMEKWMVKLFTNWGDLSGRLIRADADGDEFFRLPSSSELKERIPSALEAATYVALLLGPKYGYRATLARNSGGDEYVPRGQPMMEVLSVQIPRFSGDLSGTITVADGLGSLTLFNRQQTVRQPEDNLTLELLSRAISAWQCVNFDYNLTSGQSEYRGTYSWDIFQTTDLYADNNNSACIRLPKYGARSSSTDETVVINFGLFIEAYQVIWKVRIVNGDGYNPMNVYGSVDLSCSVGSLNYNVKLFSRSSDDCEVVYVGGDVPLLRKAMAVPLDVDVTIDVNLWDYIRGSSAQCIAQRKVMTRFGSASAAQGKFHILKPAGTTKSDVELSYMYNAVSMD